MLGLWRKRRGSGVRYTRSVVSISSKSIYSDLWNVLDGRRCNYSSTSSNMVQNAWSTMQDHIYLHSRCCAVSIILTRRGRMRVLTVCFLLSYNFAMPVLSSHNTHSPQPRKRARRASLGRRENSRRKTEGQSEQEQVHWCRE